MESADNSKHDKDSLDMFGDEEVHSVLSGTPGKRLPLMSTEELHDAGQKTKKTVEQMQKRYRYDLLHAFFRVYFIEDKDSSVEKDAVMILYQKKMPAEQQIARNALFRRLWTFFGNRIHIFQSNYRELIKGLRIRFNDQGLAYDGVMKDLEELRSAGITDFWSLKEEDLLPLPEKKPSGRLSSTPSDLTRKTSSLLALGVSAGGAMSGGALDHVSAQLDQLEAVAKSMLVTVAEIRGKLKAYDEENAKGDT